MMAGTTMIARIVARQRALLASKQWHDGSVDVDSDALEPALAQQSQSLLGDQ